MRNLIGSVVCLVVLGVVGYWVAGELGIRDELAEIGAALADFVRWLIVKVPAAVQYVAQNWHGE